MRLREKATATLLIAILMISTFAIALNVSAANPTTTESSTMEFEGTLTPNGDGYVGIIPMIEDGEYDVYARELDNAYFGNDPGSGPVWTSLTISDHDAWPTYDPDTPDWYQYSLHLYKEKGVYKWAIRNHPGATAEHPWYKSGYEKDARGVPMSGTIDWTAMYATETDVGTYLPGTGIPEIPGGAEEYDGGPACWDMDWSWGSEVVPLEYPGFEIEVTGTGDFHVKLTPAPPSGPTPVINIHQVQLQCRRWDPAGWRNWYWNYDSTLELERSGNVLHAEISYQPGVSEEEGTSMVYVYNRKENKWILHEGTIKYKSPYSELWIEEYWKGYLEFDEEGIFVHGVAYQWGYTYGDDPTWYYTHAIWDDTMDAWLLGFSVYIWDPSDVDQYIYFTENPPQDLAYHKYKPTQSPSHPPILSYPDIKPVPKRDYNPLDQ